MERKTTKLITPLTETPIEVYEYITGRESEYIQEPFLQNMKVGAIGDSASSEGISATSLHESTHRLIEKMVVAVNGKREGLLDLVLDLPSTDYQYLIEQLNELSSPKKK